MIELKVRRVGNSLGVTLPREALATLNVGENDTLFLTGAPGGYRITAYDPEFEREMDLARKIMREDRNVLRELARR